jgi:hypothetical protein
MKTFDNQGRLVGEITTVFTGNGKVITTNTVYNPTSGQAISQNISIRDAQGRVTTQNIIGGRLLPYPIPPRSSLAMNSLSVTFCDLRKASARRFSTPLSSPRVLLGVLAEELVRMSSVVARGEEKCDERKLALSAPHPVERTNENRNLRTCQHKGSKL